MGIGAVSSLGLLNKVAANIQAQVLVWTHEFSLLLGKYLRDARPFNTCIFNFVRKSPSGLLFPFACIPQQPIIVRGRCSRFQVHTGSGRGAPSGTRGLGGL